MYWKYFSKYYNIKISKLTLLIFSTIIISLTVNTKTVKAKFIDVPDNHWAYNSISQLRDLKITNGIGNNKFGLGNSIKRSEFTAFLVKLMGFTKTTTASSFSDNNDKSKWYYDAIEIAVENDIIVKDSSYFKPEEPITREDMAIMIIRALGYDELAKQLDGLESPFSDVEKNEEYIAMAFDFGIIAGMGNNKFNPQNTATREQAAMMMMNMYKKKNSKIKDLHAFYAIRSSNQMQYINKLTSIGFGWARLELAGNDVILNTTKINNNEYNIPDGFTQPVLLAKNNGILTQLLITVRNEYTNSGMPLTDYIVSNTDMHQKIINKIVAQINNTEYNSEKISFDGVVIDFENMKGNELKQKFNIFLTELKKELDKSNKKLYVAVHPQRKSNLAYFDAYDYKTISNIADKIILMAHDYNAKILTESEMQTKFTTTPLTPIAEIYIALKYITESVSDVSKIMLQLNMDSAQFKIKDNKIINQIPFNPEYSAILERINSGAKLNYSSKYQNPYITFYNENDETENIVWYEDSRSIEAKVKLAAMFTVNDISIWRLGIIPDFSDVNANLDIWQTISKLL